MWSFLVVIEVDFWLNDYKKIYVVQDLYIGINFIYVMGYIDLRKSFFNVRYGFF